MTGRDEAKRLLHGGEYTCVLCKGEQVFTTTKRGVKPLVDWLYCGADFSGFAAADKVVGKGAAYLYVLLRVRSVYAAVISQGAYDVLEAHGIDVEYGAAVEHIVNRSGKGICPFEEAVDGAQSAEEALAAILQRMEQLQIPLPDGLSQP